MLQDALGGEEGVHRGREGRVRTGRGGVGTRDRARGSPYDYSLGIYSLSTGTFPAQGPPYSSRYPSYTIYSMKGGLSSNSGCNIGGSQGYGYIIPRTMISNTNYRPLLNPGYQLSVYPIMEYQCIEC